MTAAVATQPTASRGPPAPQPQGASRGQLQRIDPDSYEEQLRVLNSRIDEFRGLAIGYRKENKLEEAKKYLLYMKGLEPMLELAKSGVRVDLTQVPPSTKPAAGTPPVKRMTDLKKATDEDAQLFSELEQSCKLVISNQNGSVRNSNRLIPSMVYALELQSDISPFKDKLKVLNQCGLNRKCVYIFPTQLTVTTYFA